MIGRSRIGSGAVKLWRMNGLFMGITVGTPLRSSVSIAALGSRKVKELLKLLIVVFSFD